MRAPTQEAIDKARLKLNQRAARLQSMEARAALALKKLESRRKLIAGSVLLDALAKGESVTSYEDMKARIKREIDARAFEGWSVKDWVDSRK